MPSSRRGEKEAQRLFFKRKADTPEVSHLIESLIGQVESKLLDTRCIQKFRSVLSR